LVNFFNEDIDFDHSSLVSVPDWLHFVASNESYHIDQINLIFCSDIFLLDINSRYLNHHFLTDVITFDNSDTDFAIEGDIFISIDRVQDNAVLYRTTFIDELLRVIVHGLLHLMGYDDRDLSSKALMSSKETAYLSFFNKV